MLKRLLVVVDGSKAGKAARDLAVKFAKEKHARLTGMTVLDTAWITAAQAEPLGGAAYKLNRDEEVIKLAKVHVEFILNEFKKACSDNQIDCKALKVEGFPASEIEYLSHEHDLIIIGQTTDFNYELEEETDSIVKHVAQDIPRPLIIAPPYQVQSDTILIAYDGTIQSARALHIFLLLGLTEGKNIHIVSVNKSKTEAVNIASQAQRMCKVYGINAEVHGVATRSDAAKIILEKVDELNIGMVVLGAFGQTSLRQVIFGSTTSQLMKKSKVPLFLHH